MAEPIQHFPPKEDYPHLIRELHLSIDLLAEHLQRSLDNHNLATDSQFLKSFAENVINCSKLIKSFKFQEIGNSFLRHKLEEILPILMSVLHLSLDMAGGSSHMTLLDAAQTPSELPQFFKSLDNYPESTRILIQELDLLSKELQP